MEAPGRSNHHCRVIARLSHQPSKQIAEGCARSNPFRRKHTGERHRDVPGRVVCNELEGPGVRIAVWAQLNLLSNLRSSRRIPDAAGCILRVIALPGEMIDEVSKPSRPRPDAQAEATVLRRACGIHDLRPVAVHHHKSVVDYAGKWRIVHGLSSEDHMPHTHNGRSVLVVVVESCPYEIL